ncbi:MFS general substrate transporter [Patellaria atrata CBS 101060]|uniref:MFS general substrate transporter n=1 Tax=Patellaria atrata CBS 101060 TaxID=1346257 RepID=A0A9P4VQF0_9PEZI|nr:MFS general substrate transporter [Patellaria atrata CBS 101060]
MARTAKPEIQPRRKSSALHYQTFPTQPPTSRGRPPTSSYNSYAAHSAHESSSPSHHESPLPKKQLGILAVIALAEQTALNSISPYLPDMASTFPEVESTQVGLYVGLIASSFALAQFATNFFWGWLSDRIGRKPVILIGTFSTAVCFVLFGFCRTLWQAIIVQALMGLVNGNQGVVSTCLGEITDRSNQSRAFTYLPVVYGIGGILGPVLGGILVFKEWNGISNPYPYLAPNLLSAVILLIDLILTMIFLEESLEEVSHLPPLGKRITSLFSWIWQFASSTRPSYLHERRANHYHLHFGHNEDGDSEESDGESRASVPALFPDVSTESLSRKDVFTRDTILLLVTFLVFQLANISYNSLYPIFGQAKPPTGRDLSPEEIGLSLGFAGLMTIIFQVGIYGRLRDKIGNKLTYRISLGAFVVAFILMPWVGYKDSKHLGIGQGKVWIWIELGIVLIIKTIAAVGGLTSALLLITNSAPNHSVLGTLNGLAQTLSAAGRAAGPFISGALFSASTHVKPKGEALAFGIFGGISFIGLLLSFGIRGENLEAEGFDEEEGEESDDDEDEEDNDNGNEEQQTLLRK